MIRFVQISCFHTFKIEFRSLFFDGSIIVTSLLCFAKKKKNTRKRNFIVSFFPLFLFLFLLEIKKKKKKTSNGVRLKDCFIAQNELIIDCKRRNRKIIVSISISLHPFYFFTVSDDVERIDEYIQVVASNWTPL